MIDTEKPLIVDVEAIGTKAHALLRAWRVDGAAAFKLALTPNTNLTESAIFLPVVLGMFVQLL